MFRLQAHRGVASEFPENTMPAFIAAREQGYRLIELDPRFTSDGQFIILHDQTLTRTARDADGVAPTSKISEIPLEVARSFDFGVWMGDEFKGTKIPTLGEVLDFAAGSPTISLKFDNVWTSFGDELCRKFLATVAAHGAKNVGFTCASLDALRLAAEAVPWCELHYDGKDLSDETLAEVKAIAEGHRLTIWVSYDNPGTAWFTGTKASPEVCDRVRKYGEVGTWLLTEDDEYDYAVDVLHVDAIETDGRIKPRG